VQTANVFINSPPRLVGNPLITDVQGENLGSILFNSYGGTPFSPPNDYLYSIDGNTPPFTNNPLFSDLTVGTYDLHVEDSLGCPWDSTVIIGMISLDVTVVLTHPACYGENTGIITLILNDGDLPFDITISWIEDTMVLDNWNFRQFVYSPLYAGIYRIRVDDNNGRRFETIDTIKQPDQIINAIETVLPTCQEFALDGNPSNDGSISITSTGGAGEFTYSWNDIATNDSSRTGLSPGTYIVNITDGNDCSVGNTIILNGDVFIDANLGITSNPPQLSVDPRYISDTAGCYLSAWVLSVEHGGSTTPIYQWTPASLLDNLADTNISAASIKLRQPASYEIRVTLDQCYDIDQINVDMYDTIGMHIETNGNRILDTIYVPLLSPIDLESPAGYESYVWDGEGIFDNFLHQNVVLTASVGQMITITGTTEDGCNEYDTVYVIIQEPIEDTYSVFTPNNDGYNDYWKISATSEQYFNIEVYIYNRWGQLVFHSDHYGTDESNRWYGKSTKNGKYLPVGTYYYIMKPNAGVQKPITGTVTIVR
jgi:gliding motility-associated-like protein